LNNACLIVLVSVRLACEMGNKSK